MNKKSIKIIILILLVIGGILFFMRLTNNTTTITGTGEETKDGVYVGNVLIPDEVRESLNYQKEEYIGKKVKVTGTIEEVQSATEETDENGNIIYTQGREGTTRVFKTIDSFEIQKE